MKHVSRQTANVAIWIVLLTMPYWMGAIGGYTELATRIVVLGLAAMALNFLLGFTGVLSFGHAAYFGLGAYGAAMTIRYLAPSTALAIVVGVVVGTVAAALIGALIVRLRGVYFAMVTIAFGQVFYFITFRWNNVTGGDDGLTGWHREPLHLGFMQLDILQHDKAFYYFALAIRALARGHTRERAARAIPGNSHRTSRLDFVRDLVHVRKPRRNAVRPSQQLHRSTRTALEPVGQLRDHGGSRRHAVVLGPAHRGGDIRRTAGLRLQPHRELDVGHRRLLRVDRAVLPARRPWCHTQADRIVSLLQVENVSRHFGSLVAVRDVSMRVEPGELRAVIGPNGAGKTTFFNLISGFFPPTSGRTLFDGIDITRLAPQERVQMGIARTFQITEIFPELSVRENLRIATETAAGLRLRPWLPKARATGIEKRVSELLDMGGLTRKADRLASELPHGDQRATEILMSLALNPRLLLLDEPTAGMGDQETYDITRLIRRLHRDHKLSIVLIEHDMRVIFHLADRIMVLAEGAMLAEGTPEQIAADDRVQAAYLGKAA
jgi:branched-chain amino acid transport system ATP-binding protein